MEQTLDPSPDNLIPWSYRKDADVALSTVLIVEDDRDIRDMLSTLLDFAGYAVRACATAEEALHVLREQSVDLVLTDYALPVRTGLWLIENAAAEGLTDDTPVMILTAHPHVAAAADYEVIPKPFDIDDLIERVKRRTEHTRPRRRNAASGGDGAGRLDGNGPWCPEPVELVLYVNADSPRSAAAVRRLRKALEGISSPRAKLTICETTDDRCTTSLDRTASGPRTYILGHITNPEPLLELLADCD
jgi:CheY-like chemotaxis protein